MTQNMSAAKATLPCALTRPDNSACEQAGEDEDEFVADLEFLEVGHAGVMTSTTCERGIESVDILIAQEPAE
jgi:hypothetical protein